MLQRRSMIRSRSMSTDERVYCRQGNSLMQDVSCCYSVGTCDCVLNAHRLHPVLNGMFPNNKIATNLVIISPQCRVDYCRAEHRADFTLNRISFAPELRLSTKILFCLAELSTTCRFLEVESTYKVDSSLISLINLGASVQQSPHIYSRSQICFPNGG